MSGDIESLTHTQCVDRLAQHDVGRVSVSVDAMPVIVPVLYAIDGDDIVFEAPLDVTLAAACDHAVIAFEVDHISHAANGGWSVQALGVANVVRDRDLTDTEQRVRLPLERMSGRKSCATAARARTA
jgi:nitroimidazol reductase NimA-like FMN-containing flavoprotein (pyridoxamine 5'-phosphate oxidase superfamily)